MKVAQSDTRKRKPLLGVLDFVKQLRGVLRSNISLEAMLGGSKLALRPGDRSNRLRDFSARVLLHQLADGFRRDRLLLAVRRR